MSFLKCILCRKNRGQKIPFGNIRFYKIFWSRSFLMGGGQFDKPNFILIIRKKSFQAKNYLCLKSFLIFGSRGIDQKCFWTAMNTSSCRNGAVKVNIPVYANIANITPRSKLSIFVISNRNLIGPSYMQFSISNKSSWAYVFNYPIVMPTNISRGAGIGRPLHPLKAKDMMKDKVIEIDWKNGMRALHCGAKHINQRLLKLRIQSFLCQSARHGCAGIGRLVHPLKVKYWIKFKSTKIECKHEMWVCAYQSNGLQLKN